MRANVEAPFLSFKGSFTLSQIEPDLPGHEKNTLYEADDYLAGKLETWGYQVEREGIPVQAFRRDTSKPKYASESTIRFLFCNEEHTPWTSKTAAQKAKSRGDNIVAVFNMDGIGAKMAEETAAGKKTNVTVYTKPEGRVFTTLL